MKHSRIAAAAVVVGGLLGVGLSTQAASAGSNLCPPSQVCLYATDDFQLLMGYRSGGGALQDISPGNNDILSSWENKSGWNAAWYYGTGGTGGCRQMLIGTENRSLSNFDDNEASSWKTNEAC
jgi:hypothetical protein